MIQMRTLFIERDGPVDGSWELHKEAALYIRYSGRNREIGDGKTAIRNADHLRLQGGARRAKIDFDRSEDSQFRNLTERRR